MTLRKLLPSLLLIGLVFGGTTSAKAQTATWLSIQGTLLPPSPECFGLQLDGLVSGQLAGEYAECSLPYLADDPECVIYTGLGIPFNAAIGQGEFTLADPTGSTGTITTFNISCVLNAWPSDSPDAVLRVESRGIVVGADGAFDGATGVFTSRSIIILRITEQGLVGDFYTRVRFWLSTPS